MPAPLVLSVSPAAEAADVALGTPLVINFDQAIDTTSLNATTFVLSGPGDALILTSTELNSISPEPVKGVGVIPGTFTFALDAQGASVVTFTPGAPLRPDTRYDVFILGGGGLLSSAGVKALDGTLMADSYEWGFITGSERVIAPPPPRVTLRPEQILAIDPKAIFVRVMPVGNDLSLPIQIIFPGPIDPATVDNDRLLLSLEPVLGDLSVVVPPGLVPQVQVTGNKIIITVPGA